MDKQEIFERIKKVNVIRREANAILEEIPFLIEYLDWIYPLPNMEFEQRLEAFSKKLEEIDNV